VAAVVEWIDAPECGGTCGRVDGLDL